MSSGARDSMVWYLRQYISINYYAKVAGISHAIAFGMCHVGCKGIGHDHVVCCLAMWYAFLKLHKNQFMIFKSKKKLKPWHQIKTKCMFVTWGHTPLTGNQAVSHSMFSVMWYYWGSNLWSITPHTTQPFRFLIASNGILPLPLPSNSLWSFNEHFNREAM